MTDTGILSICNRALSEIGARVTVTDLSTQTTPAAVQCALQYNPLRQQLLRAAAWGFARKTMSLSQLGSAANDPQDNIYPFFYKYLYPPDCLKVRYILPPPTLPVTSDIAPDVSGGLVWPGPWAGPSRQYRFLISYDIDEFGNRRRVLITNVPQAVCVYTVDETSPALFDSLFDNAMVMGLASKLVIPLTGNVGMKKDYVALAEGALTQARVADGNEAIPTTDHTVDWIRTREVGGWGPGWTALSGVGADWGQFYGYNEPMNWGM